MAEKGADIIIIPEKGTSKVCPHCLYGEDAVVHDVLHNRVQFNSCRCTKKMIRFPSNPIGHHGRQRYCINEEEVFPTSTCHNRTIGNYLLIRSQ